MAPNALAWVGRVSVAFGKAAGLTQLESEVLTISRKVLERAPRWKQRFTALNVLNVLAGTRLIIANEQNF